MDIWSACIWYHSTGDHGCYALPQRSRRDLLPTDVSTSIRPGRRYRPLRFVLAHVFLLGINNMFYGYKSGAFADMACARPRNQRRPMIRPEQERPVEAVARIMHSSETCSIISGYVPHVDLLFPIVQ
jgi:hypothetical protein